MNATINGRTPEEIKWGLKCCSTTGKCEECAYAERCAIVAEEDPRMWFGEPVMKDALAYIQQLEARIDTLTAKAVLFDEAVAAGEKIKRERDAAVKDMKHMHLACETCIHYTPGYFCPGCRNRSNWQWRGAEVG